MSDDIVIIEDEGGEQPAQTPIDDAAAQNSSRRKKMALIVGGSALLISIGIGLFFYFRTPAPELQPLAAKPHTAKQTGSKPALSRTEIEAMIEKANLLYKKGDKEKALQLFEEITQFNETLSHYNLGVAKLKEGSWAEAMALFDKALTTDEHRTPAALNAAVCAKELNQTAAYNRYLSIAEESLPATAGSPLYSYYYTLLRYYQGRPIEALAAALHPTSDLFAKEHAKIAAQMANLIDDSALAIKMLQKEGSLDSALPLGLLYARLGNYDEAIHHLENAERLGTATLPTLMAQALVQIKRRKLNGATLALNRAILINEGEASTYYQIRTMLKETLFDINRAQQEYMGSFLPDKESLYATLFYYAPYKIFNPNHTIADIKKGELQLLGRESAAAMSYMEQTAKSSNTNGRIAQGIKMALTWHLVPANTLFKELESRTTGNSILQYNLALTYAQLRNYPMAHKHFLRAYHFDQKNYMAGIFALMTGELTNNENRRILTTLKQDLLSDNTKTGLEADERDLCLSMLYVVDNNAIAASRWFDRPHMPSPMGHMMELIIALKTKNETHLKSSSTALRELLPRDILANIVFASMANRGRPIKELAYKAQELLASDKLDLSSLYYGPSIVSNLYVRMGFITGLLPSIELKLKQRLRTERSDVVNGLKALAMAQIYLKKFEESYANYSHLVDDLGETDSQTAFLASIASMGAGKNAEATGYLELAKATDPFNLEARYGLGMLYIEAGNLKAAANALKALDNREFNSQYFDFVLTN